MSKAKKIFFESAGWTLFVAALAILFVTINVFVSGELRDSKGSFIVPLVTMVGVLVTTAGVLVAISGQLFAHSNRISDKNEELSRYYLDSCVLAYEEAWKILKDGTNKRIDWVQASTALKNAEILKEKVTEKPHLLVLEVHMLKYRYAFSEVLNQPGIFFYGVSPRAQPQIDNLSREKMLDKAYALSKKVQVGRHQYQTYNPDVYPIPPEALVVVASAAKFSGKLEEHPIYGLRFSDEERAEMSFHHPGVAEYLDHKEGKDRDRALAAGAYEVGTEKTKL